MIEAINAAWPYVGPLLLVFVLLGATRMWLKLRDETRDF